MVDTPSIFVMATLKIPCTATSYCHGAPGTEQLSGYDGGRKHLCRFGRLRKTGSDQEFARHIIPYVDTVIAQTLQEYDRDGIVYSHGSSHTSRIEMNVSYPEHKSQTVHVKAISGGDLSNMNIRLGPFDPEIKKVKVSMNGQRNSNYPCFKSGDKAWTWVVVKEVKVGSEITILVQD